MLQEPNYIESIANELNLQQSQLKTVLDFISEGSTVPFIARYRKEHTGNLDENDIRAIIDLQKKLENLYNAKKTAINGIEEVGMMTEELMKNILKALTLKEVEEIYKPFKSKKKTKAMIAIEKGFQVVADNIKSGNLDIPDNLLKDYPREEIIEGAIFILSAEISSNADLRHLLIEELEKFGLISSKKKTQKSLDKLNDKDTKQIPKFELYFEFEAKLKYIKPYQILALNRGEKIGILNIKVEKDEIIFQKVLRKYMSLLGLRGDLLEELEKAFKDGYDGLFSSVENEIRSKLSEIAEDSSIESFQINLKSLLLSKPCYGQKVLAIDPGFAAGCKVVVLDTLSNPLTFDKVFLHSRDKLQTKIKNLIEKYDVDVIVIGNGTGTDEIQNLVLDITKIDIYVVNESGASVYSVSKIAEEEFPELDNLDRGTVCLARRYVDPLSEFVKVPVGSIGVGMYQHDMPEKKLEEKLGHVVEDSVNEVGINVNTASIYLLNHISGIDKRQAKKIYKNRPYTSRADLKKVLSEKSYEQAIGFLRVPESKEKLDNTDIHPEQYELARYIIDSKITSPDNKAKEIYSAVNEDTIDFIINSYNNLGIEKRVNFGHFKVEAKKDASELKTGDKIIGIVRNVVAFGAFVDIGAKNDGLVHISQMVDRFISDPNEIVKVGDKIDVKIVKIDETTGKIQLSMKEI